VDVAVQGLTLGIGRQALLSFLKTTSVAESLAFWSLTG
jgi:hypothetical protein